MRGANRHRWDQLSDLKEVGDVEKGFLREKKRLSSWEKFLTVEEITVKEV